jgi:hypothetical protein
MGSFGHDRFATAGLLTNRAGSDARPSPERNHAMSITYRLQTVAFPDDYAEILIESLAVTPDNFLDVKDILYHFRDLEDDQAAEVMQVVSETVEAITPQGRNGRVSENHRPVNQGDFDAPWSLRFERDGTEDIAVICDGDADELVRSRHFWLPNADDPEPPTLAAMRLIHAAPALLTACQMVVARWERGDLAEAARASQSAVELATANAPPWDVTDGQTAVSNPWSVLLLYPDYANDSGTETFYAFVEATDPLDAITLAQRQAADSQEGIDIEPDDFAPLLVTQEHQYGEPLFNK